MRSAVGVDEGQVEAEVVVAAVEAFVPALARLEGGVFAEEQRLLLDRRLRKVLAFVPGRPDPLEQLLLHVAVCDFAARSASAAAALLPPAEVVQRHLVESGNFGGREGFRHLHEEFLQVQRQDFVAFGAQLLQLLLEFWDRLLRWKFLPNLARKALFALELQLDRFSGT